MKYDPEKHHRGSIRLKGYDYSKVGAYFVTICVYNRERLLGSVIGGEMETNEAGHLAAECWEWLAEHYTYVELDEWIIMPNHLHGIVLIRANNDRSSLPNDGRGGLPNDGRGGLPNDGRGGSRTAPTAKAKPLGRIIGAFKTVSSKYINKCRGTPGESIWQRNYYEHIVRNESELNRIREYIAGNPRQWEWDRENPTNVGAVREPPLPNDLRWRI